MKFRTEYTPERSDLTLDPGLPIAMAGSCFTENMARRMRSCNWEAVNPLGTLYNPVSIATALRLALLSENPESDFRQTVFPNGAFFSSWMFDSKLTSGSTEETVSRFMDALQKLRLAVEGGNILIVTFGTAWCYALENGTTVGNCHKQPATLFTRYRLGVEEIAETWTDLCCELKERCPGLEIIFTVSPVRHLKDGFEGNARSKAILLLAVEKICRKTDSRYFPAYEILTDDLRDYRFYASDLVHPSEEGIEYIWEKFKETYLDSRGIEMLRLGEKQMKRLAHRSIVG